MSQGLFEVFEIKNNDVLRIREWMTKYKDLPMDLADASLVVLAEKCQTEQEEFYL